MPLLLNLHADKRLIDHPSRTAQHPAAQWDESQPGTGPAFVTLTRANPTELVKTVALRRGIPLQRPTAKVDC
jgi:hypothetical protein